MTTYVVKTPHHNILVDACIGNDKTFPLRPSWNAKKDGNWMAALKAAGLGQRPGAFDKAKGFAEVLETIGPLDPRRIVDQRPIGCLAAILLGRLAAEWRDPAATRGAALLGQSCRHRDPLLDTGERLPSVS